MISLHERLGRLALVAASTAGVGLVAALVLGLQQVAGGAAWAAAATGVLIWLAVTFFGMRAGTGLHTLRYLGWTGLVCGVIAGGALVAPVFLLLSGHGETAALVGGLSLVPLLFAVGCVGAEYSPGTGDDLTTSASMVTITSMNS